MLHYIILYNNTPVTNNMNQNQTDNPPFSMIFCHVGYKFPFAHSATCASESRACSSTSKSFLLTVLNSTSPTSDTTPSTLINTAEPGPSISVYVRAFVVSFVLAFKTKILTLEQVCARFVFHAANFPI